MNGMAHLGHPGLEPRWGRSAGQMSPAAQPHALLCALFPTAPRVAEREACPAALPARKWGNDQHQCVALACPQNRTATARAAVKGGGSGKSTGAIPGHRRSQRRLADSAAPVGSPPPSRGTRGGPETGGLAPLLSHRSVWPWGRVMDRVWEGDKLTSGPAGLPTTCGRSGGGRRQRWQRTLGWDP